MFLNLIRATTTLGFVAVLSACGGGTDAPAANPQVSPRLLQREAVAVAPALCASGAAGPTDSVAYQQQNGQCTTVFTGGSDGKLAQAKATRVARAAKPVDATAFMNWVQQVLAPYFPDASPNIVLPGWTVRYYPTTQNYIGVTDDGAIYVLGPVTGGALAGVGKLSDFACSVFPENCPIDLTDYTLQLPNDKALVTQGGSFQVTVNVARTDGFTGAV